MNLKLLLAIALVLVATPFIRATDCGLGLQITDNSNNGTPSSITINSAPGVEMGLDVVVSQVELVIDHDRVSDLFVRLYSPGGDYTNLAAQVPVNDADFGDPTDNSCLAVTRFVNDFGATPIASGTAPFIGDFFPSQELNNFTGSPLGDWTLVVWDLEQDISGSLEYWDMTLSVLPACQPPSEIFAEVFQDTIVYINWLSNNNELSWNIEYDEAGFVFGDGNASVSFNDSLTLSGLLPNTEYEIYLQADCDTLLSSWSGPYLFVTECLPFLGDSLGGPFVVTGLPYTDTGSSAECYTDALTSFPGPDVVYRFQMGNCADSVTVSTCGSDYDTSLFIYDAQGVQVFGNGDFCGVQSKLTMPVTSSATYYAVIEGKGGSTGNYQITITENISIPVLDSYGAVPVSCYGESDGGFVFAAFGGTPPYTYEWQNGSATGNVNNLPAGNYNITVVDATGCEGNPVSVTIPQPEIFLVFGNVTNESAPDAFDGAIQLNVSGSVPPYTYIWDTGATTSLIENLFAERYCVTITDDTNCQITTCIPVFELNTAIRPIIDLVDFQLFPNPSQAGTWLEVDYRGNASLEIEVLNVLGEVVLSYNLAQKENSILLETGELASGAYFVRLKAGNGQAVKRLIKL